MKKKIISFIAALALAVTAAFGALPSLYENSGEANSEFESETVTGAETESETGTGTEIEIGNETEIGNESETEPEAEPVPVQPVLIEINEENFPDENFRSFAVQLEESIADNGIADGAFSENEIALITSVSVRSMSVKDLAGIEFFTALETLDCSDNDIENLDLSGNTNLKELYCSENNLHELDVSGLQQLAKLDCGYNELSELVLTQNPMLNDLHISANPITELDLSNNPDLQRFEASYTKLTSLNIENHNPYDSANGMEFEQFVLNESLYTVTGCTYESLGFDLASLPGGFNTEKASRWSARPPEGTLLTNIKAGDTVTYTYEITSGITAEFSITFAEKHSIEKVEDTSALCTDADELWKCTECGKYFEDENGETETGVNHLFSKYTVEVEPTCTHEGVAVKICAVCGYEEREALNMFPHVAQDHYTFNDTYHYKTCLTCGTELEKGAHVFENGSKVCSVCGAEVDHVHTIEFVEEKKPTCIETGVRAHYCCTVCGRCFIDSELAAELSPADLIIEKIDHQYELAFNGTEHWEQCVFCGEKKEASAHEFESVRTEPTCCKDGAVTNVCRICQYSAVAEVIPATGDHTFGTEYGSDDDFHWLSCTGEGCTERIQQSAHSCTKLEIIKNPTCAEEGEMAHICEVCGHRKLEPIAKLNNHTYDGYKQLDEYNHTKVCSACGEASQTEPHSFDQGTVIKEATCENGIIRYTCVCGYAKDEIIPAVSAHSFGSYTDLGDTHSAMCSVCGALSLSEAHEYSIKTVSPSCYQSGKIIYTCKQCGHSYSEIVSEATGQHSFSSSFTLLDGGKHCHKCETRGCPVVLIHDADECEFDAPPVTEHTTESSATATDPASTTSVSESVSETTSSGAAPVNPSVETPVINVTWPTTAGIVLNPYKMKINMSPSSHGQKPVIFEDPEAEGKTVLSNELAFVNNGSCKVNVFVTGSVSAVTTVDRYGNPLVDSEGNPVTTPSKQITIATSPIKQPAWDSSGTSVIDGDRNNSVFIYLEASDRLDSTGKSAVYSGAYDSNNENQMLLSTVETTKNLFSISAKEDGNSGITNLKIFGDISTSPAVSWDQVAATDSIKISLVFDVKPAEPLPKKVSSEESGAETQSEPAEETSEVVLTAESEEMPKETSEEISEHLPKEAIQTNQTHEETAS